MDDDNAGNEIGWNVRDLISGDAVNTYSDGRPVATTIQWDDGWVTHDHRRRACTQGGSFAFRPECTLYG